MANSGIDTDVNVSTDNTTFNPVGGANSVSQNLQRALIEVTEFGDGAIDRISGLFDTPVSISGFYKAADAGQSALRAQLFSGGSIYVQVLADGTNGYAVECLVESFEIGSDPSGAATFSASLQSKAAPVAVP